jgi:hypothetical protein
MRRRDSAGLNRRQQAVAALLAAGKSAVAAAREAGVGERTVHTWLGTDGFRREVERLRGELFGAALGSLSGFLTKAVATLGELLDSDEEKIRLAAARGILADAATIRQSIDLNARIEELERRSELGKSG